MDIETKNFVESQIRNHIHDGNYSQRVNALDIFQDYRYILYRILPPTTTNVVTNTVGGDLVMPFGGSIYEVGATVDIAGTTGTTQVDINNNATTILSTKITIDSTEKTSRTATTPSVISLPNFSTGDILTFDIDTIQTTPATGLTMFLKVIPTTQ